MDMWYSCAVAVDSWFEKPPVHSLVELSSGVRLEPVPDWVKSDEALEQLSSVDQERIRNAELAFSITYEADALGTPDPDWEGKNARGIQDSAEEKFALMSVSLWLVQPSRLVTCGPVFHFGRDGDPTSCRRSGSLSRIYILDGEEQNAPTADNLKLAGKFLSAILALPRKGAVWNAVSMLFSSLVERRWELRYPFQWIALEALFGPENPGETVFRLTQRIGLFVGSDVDERRRLIAEARKAYNWRSKIVHGRRLTKLSSEESSDLSIATENLLRRSLTKILMDTNTSEYFDGKARDQFLDELIFQ